MTAEELRAMVRRYLRGCLANGADKEYMCMCAWSLFCDKNTDRGVYYMEELYHIREQFRKELK